VSKLSVADKPRDVSASVVFLRTTRLHYL